MPQKSNLITKILNSSKSSSSSKRISETISMRLTIKAMGTKCIPTLVNSKSSNHSVGNFIPSSDGISWIDLPFFCKDIFKTNQKNTIYLQKLFSDRVDDSTRLWYLSIRKQMRWSLNLPQIFGWKQFLNSDVVREVIGRKWQAHRVEEMEISVQRKWGSWNLF